MTAVILAVSIKPFSFILPSFYSYSILLFKLSSLFLILLSPLPQMWIFSVFKSLLETRTGKANLKMPSKLSQSSSTDLIALVHQKTSQRTFMFKQKIKLDIIAKTEDMLFVLGCNSVLYHELHPKGEKPEHLYRIQNKKLI